MPIVIPAELLDNPQQLRTAHCHSARPLSFYLKQFL
ncbi:Uncharacterised protein [uncultured Blautia sp.]|nr:Uncharacterised protein [uncultured Blautia sp.]